MDSFAQVTSSGSLILAVPVALLAGLVSFFSPCVLPLLPGYISYATGISGADLAAGGSSGRRSHMLIGCALFVCGFGTVFVIIGSVSGGLAAWLVTWSSQLQFALGLMNVVLGLSFAGWLPLFRREWRFHGVPRVGVAAAPLLGFLFGVGWTPCIGPTLAAITTLSYAEGTAQRGALLAAVYALGLGIPFLLGALGYKKALTVFALFGRHQVGIMRFGGIMLIGVGLLLMTGLWAEIVTWLQSELAPLSENLI